MRDAELFFQAADHHHLFLYIDGLAETEARRQTDICTYARKRLDDYEALQKKVERLEQELQQEKDDNALLQAQLPQQSRERAPSSELLAMPDDRQTEAQARLCTEMTFLYQKFHRTRTFPLLRKPSLLLTAVTRIGSARQRYLRYLHIEDMDQLLLCAQSASETLQTLDAFAAQYFSQIPDLRKFFILVARCLDLADADGRRYKNKRSQIQTFVNDIQCLEQKILKGIVQQKTRLARLLSVARAFLAQETDLTSGDMDNELTNFIYAKKTDALTRNTPSTRKSVPGDKSRGQR